MYLFQTKQYDHPEPFEGANSIESQVACNSPDIIMNAQFKTYVYHLLLADCSSCSPRLHIQIPADQDHCP